MTTTNNSRLRRATVSSSEARQIIDTAVKEAEAMSTPVTVAVVDESGVKRPDFGSPARPQTAPALKANSTDANTPATTPRRRSGILEHETGFEPATLTLATCAIQPLTTSYKRPPRRSIPRFAWVPLGRSIAA